MCFATDVTRRKEDVQSSTTRRRRRGRPFKPQEDDHITPWQSRWLDGIDLRPCAAIRIPRPHRREPPPTINHSTPANWLTIELVGSSPGIDYAKNLVQTDPTSLTTTFCPVCLAVSQLAPWRGGWPCHPSILATPPNP